MHLPSHFSNFFSLVLGAACLLVYFFFLTLFFNKAMTCLLLLVVCLGVHLVCACHVVLVVMFDTMTARGQSGAGPLKANFKVLTKTSWTPLGSCRNIIHSTWIFLHSAICFGHHMPYSRFYKSLRLCFVAFLPCNISHRQSIMYSLEIFK